MATGKDRSLRWRWQVFNRWQRTPHQAPPLNLAEKHHCANCGTDFAGNFCPRCGQDTSVRPLSVASILQHFLEVWGVGSKVFLRSARDLILRPGYMIADFIKGHRQSYFPPFRMLFITVAIAIFIDILLPQWQKAPEPFSFQKGFDAEEIWSVEEGFSKEEIQQTVEQRKSFASILHKLDIVTEWFNNHLAILLLLRSSLTAFFLTLIFKQTPRLGRTSFLINFYALVYIITQMLLVGMILSLLTFPFRYHQVGNLPMRLSVPIAIINYKQLYGFKWWTTIWKSLLVETLSIVTLITLALVVMLVAALFVGLPIS